MRTTVSKRRGAPAVVTHELEEGEEWEELNATQPNRLFSHDEAWWPHCHLCSPLLGK